MYRAFFCIFKMYNTEWAKSRRALDCFFIFMAEILGGYWQILDRSGKKIILLSPLDVKHTAGSVSCYRAALLRAGLKPMQLHWAPRLWAPHAMVFEKVVRFLQVLLELENSIERLINLAVSKQLSHLNQRWIFYTKHYQKYSIFMLYKALYLRSSISHSMNGAWLLLTY